MPTVHASAVLTCSQKGGSNPPAPVQQGRKRNISDLMGQLPGREGVAEALEPCLLLTILQCMVTVMLCIAI